MELDYSELQQEAEVLTFVSKMKENMSRFSKSVKDRVRLAGYNKCKPTERTKRHQKQQIAKRTKALRAAGYADISSFFQTRSSFSASRNSVETVSSRCPTVAPGLCSQKSEEEESLEEDRGLLRREEEEESEEEDCVGSARILRKAMSPMPATFRSSPQAPMRSLSQEEEHSDLSSSDGRSDRGSASEATMGRPRACPPAPDSPLLQKAIYLLNKQIKKRDLLDVDRKRITAMAGFLNIYTTSPHITWTDASVAASMASGNKESFARSLRMWVWDLLEDDVMPVLRFGCHRKSRIEDEDFSQEIQLHLQTLGKKYFSAMDIIRFLDKPDVQARLKIKRTPTKRTVRNWLKLMDYCYGTGIKGMYIDGHEREDVVNYRQNHFLPLWSILESRMTTWTSQNQMQPPVLPDFLLKKRIVLITHDESTFYAHDRRKKQWFHKDESAEPIKKGEGASLMVSDFVSPDLGWLKSKDGKQEARIIFKAGRNRDGYFNCEDLCNQIETAIELFEDNFPGNAIAAFGFDNAPSHQKRAADALSARYMPKFPKRWWGKKGVCKVRNGVLPNGNSHDFYFPDDHPQFPGYFKGMARIFRRKGINH